MVCSSRVLYGLYLPYPCVPAAPAHLLAYLVASPSSSLLRNKAQYLISLYSLCINLNKPCPLPIAHNNPTDSPPRQLFTSPKHEQPTPTPSLPL